MERIKLTQICNPKQWKTIPTSELLEEGYPVYGANGVIGYYSEYNHKGSVVAITCRGATCGTINITVPEAYVTGNAMCLDDVRSDIDIKYLYYNLLHFDFGKVISGSAQPQITRQGLEKVVVPIGTQDEQRRIISILDKTSSVIESRKQELKTLDDLIKARFVEMFGDAVINPYRYEQVTIGDACTLINGRAFKPSDWGEEGLPIVRIQNLNDTNASFNYYDGQVNEQHLIDSGMLLFSWSGTPGTSFGAFMWNRGPGALNQHIFKVIPKLDFDLDYLRYAMNGQLSTIIAKAHGGVGLQHITKAELEKIVLLHPKMREQKQFAAFVAQVDKSKVVVQKALNEAQLLFDSLMQKYFG